MAYSAVFLTLDNTKPVHGFPCPQELSLIHIWNQAEQEEIKYGANLFAEADALGFSNSEIVLLSLIPI